MAILPDGRELNFELPQDLRLGIADATILYSRIDTIILEIIWELRGSDLNEKRKLARRSAAQNIEELRGFIEASTSLPFKAIWSSLDNLRTERALITHGVWMLVDGRWFVLWHKEFLTYKDDVTAELFEKSRFDLFMKKARNLYDMLFKFRQMLPMTAKKEMPDCSNELNVQPPSDDKG